METTTALRPAPPSQCLKILPRVQTEQARQGHASILLAVEFECGAHDLMQPAVPRMPIGTAVLHPANWHAGS